MFTQLTFVLCLFVKLCVQIFNRICDGDHKLEKQRRKGRAVCEIDDILTAHKVCLFVCVCVCVCVCVRLFTMSMFLHLFDDYFQEFLRTITERCFEVLHPLCTYQRRHFALSVLQLMNTIFSSTLSERVAGTPFSLLVTKSHGHALLHTLWDTFDSNRSIAVELLLTLPQDKTGVQVCTLNMCITVPLSPVQINFCLLASLLFASKNPVPCIVCM